MKIDPASSHHLTYCTNIHPGETWPEVFENLQTYVTALKQRLCPDEEFGVGLRLANAATHELLQGNALAEFQTWLDRQGLYVFTLNGFPYGGFHHQVVKDRVYAPDWTDPDRLSYTLRLIKILAILLPTDIEDGGISTLPLSYKPWRSDNLDSVFEQSCYQLAQAVAKMAYLAQETGKVLHLDIEPEPDGLLENAAEVIAFFHQWLLPVGGSLLVRQGLTQAQAEAWLREHVRVCYDTCHFAVEYEEPETAITQLQSTGIQIGKLQLSSALRVSLPPDSNQRRSLQSRLQPFAESTYLHQVSERHTDGTLHHFPDLITALPQLEHTSAQEWRTHFHVPIFLRDYRTLNSTQDHIEAALRLLPDRLRCHHLEIETYTWDVLPAAMQIDLLASIQREYEWVLKSLVPALTRPPTQSRSCKKPSFSTS
ncbi:metabolite traffic protein EboE [Romeria aff. gracilis LEGE 07310]|uniref:Metabolite traffic protein EboE n=1 Tax=Vasconcelosia minhoensis LEGE 07310 TaxID=915328 RepID=A0A8J7A7I0_9CYAN|nr:metabolite traffic protein EboE [Romeria gracilis]MBE9077530.1 metabolite traffic protein EboE [Romeria aff. gracilis LEGE 07310]